jgi:hypothetical protein
MQLTYPRKRGVVELMEPPLILPMDSRLMPRSRARVDVAQTHRFPEFQQAPRQTACQADFTEMQGAVRAGFMVVSGLSSRDGVP